MTVGKEGISARIIADSTYNGNRVTTFELEYPRFIHSELMTHRMLSKNCASSRAIPIRKMNEMVIQNPAMPVFWGKNQPGMSAKEELTNEELQLAQLHWIRGSRNAAELSDTMHNIGMHKQLANRVTEPWQRMKTVITGTEWANLLWLRDHEDAQPEFAELARCIRDEFEKSIPTTLRPGEWHLPYVVSEMDEAGVEMAYFSGGTRITLENALKLSASCCAQVSYRNTNETLEKAIEIYDKLVGSTHKHASPFEHQATPMKERVAWAQWEDGVTHMDREAKLWSGNFKGWVQHRQLVKDHVKW